MNRSGRRPGAVAALVAIGLAGCAMPRGATQVDPEVFGSTDLHARNLESTPQQTCEAARRALLSQGFMISAAAADRVTGRKNFQPKAETHVEIEVSVVCAPEGRGGKQTVAFVSALQDQFSLKKSNNSASVGVPVLGSLSLPIISSDDALVKVASETISSPQFYERFYRLLDRYLEATLGVDGAEPEPLAPVVPQAAASAPAPTAAGSPAAASPAAAASAASPAAAASAAPPASAASSASTNPG